MAAATVANVGVESSQLVGLPWASSSTTRVTCAKPGEAANTTLMHTLKGKVFMATISSLAALASGDDSNDRIARTICRDISTDILEFRGRVLVIQRRM
ncbi:MAG TPA: hypothetical protein VKE51_40715 [Vicinamibacterales bacterium]|nr:hypothetical protein [Vicinamibacterales bacterium]